MASSFRRIVTDLGNADQERIVTAPVAGNLLVLAGPGSGKTRVVVHRCAYLLRVERVPPRSILVCCFNRSAALEVRRRLSDLVGDDARGVLVQTYHGLALRLLGKSLGTESRNAEWKAGANALDQVIREATALLEGQRLPPGIEADEVRDRLLAGFRHILVDEYQDIDESQYAMISAIAGRTLQEAEQRLCILAVGDDDQNIYSFRGANVRFISQFQADYGAEVRHLVENHRATRYLIEGANHCIAANRDRMKLNHPIRIDRHRELHPSGGEFGRRDSESHGRIRMVSVPDGSGQAWAVLSELRRLQALGVEIGSRIAVLGETHRELSRVRALFERESIPLRWMASHATYPVSCVREVRAVLGGLWMRRSESMTAGELLASLDDGLPSGTGASNPWRAFLQRQLEAWRAEIGDARVEAGLAREYLLEACADARRGDGCEHGVAVGTVHAAKGLEFDHVILMGNWRSPAERSRQEELRRTFYVGMTRARHSLSILQGGSARNGGGWTADWDGPWLHRVPADRTDPMDLPALPEISFLEVGMEDIDLGYPGRYPAGHAVHEALARIQPGSLLRFGRPSAESGTLTDLHGVTVARFSRSGWIAWRNWLDRVREFRVLAVLTRTAGMDREAERRATYQVAEWEVPVLEVVLEGEGPRRR